MGRRLKRQARGRGGRGRGRRGREPYRQDDGGGTGQPVQGMRGAHHGPSSRSGSDDAPSPIEDTDAGRRGEVVMFVASIGVRLGWGQVSVT